MTAATVNDHKITIGFDTSNYTTSCAVFDGSEGFNSGRLLDVPEGALGIRQSEALFQHVRRLPEIFDKLPVNGRVVAVGASETPRETEGSYMPCFLAGASHGAVLARGMGIPYYGFSHQQGHVAAAVWSAGREDIRKEAFLCWHLSGGTTELLLAKPSGVIFSCEILGGTSDVSAGQLLDRAGSLLGMKFPSGAALDTMAASVGEGEEYSPKMDGMSFSLSGVEHKMKAMIEAGKPAEKIAYFTLWSIFNVVNNATETAKKIYGNLPVVYSGGVASSRFMRRRIPNGIFAKPEYSTDNAMGIAILTYRTVNADG